MSRIVIVILIYHRHKPLKEILSPASVGSLLGLLFGHEEGSNIVLRIVGHTQTRQCCNREHYYVITSPR
jgi:hypothetical protein